jgi:hypothetical protein
MRGHLFVFGPVLLFACALGCSSANETGEGDAPSGTTPGSGGAGDGNGEPGSGPSGGSSGASGSSGGSETPTDIKVGTVTVMSTAYSIGDTPVEMGSATGTFYVIPPAPAGAPKPASSCTETVTGPCTVNACTFAAAPADAGAPSITYTHAGPVKVSGVLVNDGSMTLTPGGYGYQTVSGNVAFFRGGETVRLSAPGNPEGAPAFDVSLTAPASVRVTSPVFDAQSRVTAAAGQNLNVAWTGGAGGEVAVQIGAGTQTKSAVARCGFPAASGSGSIAASVLAAVKAVGAPNVSFTVSAESRSVKSLEGWNITVALQAYGLRSGPTTAVASGLLDLP